MTTLKYLIQQYRQLRLRLTGSLLLHACVLGIGLISASPACVAQTSVLGNAEASSEARVKAAYLLRFIGYVEWPATAFSKPDSPFVVGILHADDIAEELTTLSARRTVANRPVIVKRLEASDSFNGLHVLFIGASERRQPQALKSLQQQPVLLVTETEGALAQGSMINFRIVEDRVRFDVALPPVEQSGLKINSRMLGVALSVIKGQQ